MKKYLTFDARDFIDKQFFFSKDGRFFMHNSAATNCSDDLT